MPGGEVRVGGDGRFDGLVDDHAVAFEAGGPGLGEALEQGLGAVPGLALETGAFLGDLAPSRDQLGEGVDGSASHRLPLRDELDEAGDRDRVESVILGDRAEGAGELADPRGVDQPGGKPRLYESAQDAPLEAAARLEPDRRRLQRPNPADELAPAALVVRHLIRLARRQHRHVETGLAYIDADKHLFLCHLPLPALRVRG